MPPKKAKPDKHKSGFMVRLPEPYRDALRRLKAKTDRAYTTDVRRALDAYLKANGIEPPAPAG